MSDTVLDDTVSAEAPLPGKRDDEPSPARPGETPTRSVGDGFIPDGAELDRGHSVGRYVILDSLGRGGMGVVYRAYDPELHRQVAIKVLQPGIDGTAGPTRMLREAQAMAQLAHPNVVAIHDVGTVLDNVYIAMELVDGRTLKQWIRRTKRPWKDVVEAFLQAGDGLAAAHAKGLVHRDFKPDNAMIDDTGRVRVMDFGLARTAGVLAAKGRPNASAPGPTAPEQTPLDSQLTREGAMMGTPAYMAPEQFAGLSTDARTDQFSFCIALWEGLHGLRPFEAASLTELGVAVSEGAIVEPAPSDVPAAIERALRRGLSPSPDDRWPSMEALLQALRETTKPPNRRWVLPTSIFALAGALGLGAWASKQDERCSGAEEQIAEVWNDARAQTIAEQFAAQAIPSAPEIWSKQRERVDAYASQWSTTYREACEATAVRGVQSERLLDRRMHCLDRAKSGLSAALEVLEAPDETTVNNAHRVVGGLRRLDTCSDVETLEGQTPAPEEIAEDVARIEDELDGSRASLSAGQYGDAKTIAVQAVTEARSLGYEPTLADALLALATAQVKTAEHEAAEATAEEAQRLALRHGRWLEATHATRALLYVVGNEQARFAEAQPLVGIALGLAEHTGSSRVEASVHDGIGAMYMSAGRYAEALTEFEAALALQRAEPDEDFGVVAALSNVAYAERQLGRMQMALSHVEEVLEISTETLGPRHPVVASVIDDLATTLADLGRLDEAEERYQQALQLREAILRPGHPSTASSLMNLATVLGEQGRIDEAVVLFRQALASFEKELGPTHPFASTVRLNLGRFLLEGDEIEEAEHMLRRALKDLRATLPPTHTRIANASGNLAEVLRVQGRLEESEAMWRGAIEIYDGATGLGSINAVTMQLGLSGTLRTMKRDDEAEAVLRQALAAGVEQNGESHPIMVRIRSELGELLTEGGRPSEAVPELERAYALLEGSGDASSLVPVAFNLAKARWDSNADRSRAIDLANEARRLANDGTPDGDEALAEIDAWLEAHRA